MPNRNKVSRCFFLLTLFMFLLAFVNLTPVADFEKLTQQSTTVVSEPETPRMFLAGTPHDPIAIDGDTNFSATALREGWPGDGSPENPFIIDGLDIDLTGGVDHCIMICYTRVNFIISNCSLTGASWEWPGRAGIFLDNVMYSELVKNILYDNDFGIFIESSDSCTVIDNICNNNEVGICLELSGSNTVFNNTCNNNRVGVELDFFSDSNTIANNTFTSNEYGITLYEAESNTVASNTFTSNTVGIKIISLHISSPMHRGSRVCLFFSKSHLFYHLIMV